MLALLFRYKTLVFTALLVVGMSNVSVCQVSRQIEKGDEYFYEQEYISAIDMYLFAYQVDQSIEASRRLAEAYLRVGQNEKCEEWLEITVNSVDKTPQDVLKYAEVLKILQKYPEAINQYKAYLILKPTDKRALEHIQNEKYYQDLWNDSIKYRMHILGINGDKESFGVVPYGESKYLFSSIGINNKFSLKKDKKKDLYLDVYQCDLDENEQFVQGERLLEPVNTIYHDGPVYYDKNSKVIYITRSNIDGDEPITNENGDVILKIFTHKYVDGEWGDAEELSLNNENFSTGHPCLSADGQTLFFTSNIPGGFGGADIYKSRWEESKWGDPINLGSNVNTEGDEMFPYVSKEGIIYFASNGHAGLGGMDNFLCEPWGDKWSAAYNLGSPINTNFDDFSLLFVPGEEIGFFTSNRSGKGFGDMFFFKQVDIFEQIVSGKIVVENNSFSIVGEKIKVDFLESNKSEIIEIKDDGTFSIPIHIDEKIKFTFVDTIYFSGKSFTSYNAPSNFEDPYINLGTFTIKTKDEAPVEIPPVLVLEYELLSEVLDDLKINVDAINDKNIDNIENYIEIFDDKQKNLMVEELMELKNKLKELKNLFSNDKEYVVYDETEMLVLKRELKDLNINNIYFNFDSYSITAVASTTLDSIYFYMLKNSTWEIEIDTHTDSRGSVIYNEYLSQKRANAVRRYLLAKGIEQERIHMRWYGENNRLINKEQNEADYRLNRRAEFRYLIKSER